MTATPNPIEQIGGMTSASDVPKADVVSWGKARVAQVMADAAEVNATDLSGQLAITLKSTGRNYILDTSDTTTVDNGTTCIRDYNGLAFKIVTIDGVDGADGATIIIQNSAPATTYVSGSLWIDEDSTDLDLYVLTGSPLAWVDTTKNLKGTAGIDGIDGIDGSDGSDPGILLTWDTGTSDADPGSGKIRANNASLASATVLYISKTNRAGSDISAFLAALDDSTNTAKGTLVLTDPATDLQTSFTSGAVTDATGYIKLAVSGPSGTTSYSAATPISFQFSRAGDAGAGAVSSVNGQTGTVVISVREILSAARTYYVRTDGSDSNNGLANTSGGAFLTIQAAVNAVALIDTNSKVVTIQVADGTYTGAVTLKNVTGYSAPGDLIIQGNNGTPANVVISVAGTAITATNLSAAWDIKDLKIATSSLHGIWASSSYVRFSNINLGAISSIQLLADAGGTLEATGNYAVSGSAGFLFLAQQGSKILTNNRTITFSNSPAYTYFAYAFNLSLIRCDTITFTNGGTVTGTRYSVSNNSLIFTNGGGATYLPGNAAGTATTGGQYT